MKKSIIFGALATAGMIASPAANATLVGGETLQFVDGVNSCQAGGTYPVCDFDATTVDGSWFGMDINSNGGIELGERVAISSAGTGFILDGTGQAPQSIDNLWLFSNALGSHSTDTAAGVPSVNADGSIDMTGWNVFWNGGNIDMGQGAAAVVDCGTGSCSNGESFILDYNAIVPSGGFVNTYYELHMEGTVVPVPAAVWLFGSGLLGLVGVARRRKAA